LTPYKSKLKQAGLLKNEGISEPEAKVLWFQYVHRADRYLTQSEKRLYARSRKERANVIRDGCGEII
jgi:hypothetical protein